MARVSRKPVPPSASTIDGKTWVVHSGSRSCWVRGMKGLPHYVPANMTMYYGHYVEIADREMG